MSRVPRHDVGNGFFPAGQDDGRPGSAAASTSIHLGREGEGEGGRSEPSRAERKRQDADRAGPFRSLSGDSPGTSEVGKSSEVPG
jgi:hypothetical protein